MDAGSVKTPAPAPVAPNSSSPIGTNVPPPAINRPRSVSMPSTDLMQQLPLTRDVEATPPAPTDVEPRTERHDWLFVGHQGGPEKNEPLDMWVGDAAELPRAVAAFAVRETENHLYPFIFLTPALGPVFEEQATCALVAAQKQRGAPPWPAAVLA